MKFRPCFSIRDLLWLTLVVAMATGWWLDRVGYFVALPIAASFPLSFLVGSRTRGRFRFKVVVACGFAVGWIGIAIYLEAPRVAFQGHKASELFDGPELDIPRLVATIGILPAVGAGVLLWRTWVRSANEAIDAEDQYDDYREQRRTPEVI